MLPLLARDHPLPERASGNAAHAFGLFGALVSCYAAHGVPQWQVEFRSGFVWTELMPFLYLDHNDAVEALAEYVLWMEIDDEYPGWEERPAEVPPWTSSLRLEWLKGKIREGVRRVEEDEDASFRSLVEADWPLIGWLDLLPNQAPSDGQTDVDEHFDE